jgi:hypothetical protein
VLQKPKVLAKPPEQPNFGATLVSGGRMGQAKNSIP